MKVTSENPLRAKQVQVDVEIALATAKEKGLALDEDVVAALVARDEPFDRKKMTFLEQFSKTGNPNEYLRELLAERTKLSAGEEKLVKLADGAVKRAIEDHR